MSYQPGPPCPVCGEETTLPNGACVAGCGYSPEPPDCEADADDDELDAYADKP